MVLNFFTNGERASSLNCKKKEKKNTFAEDGGNQMSHHNRKSIVEKSLIT